MKLENRMPVQDGFRMPGEFEPHEGTVMIWPVRPGSWPHHGAEAQKVFIEIISHLACDEKVWLLVNQEDEPNAECSIKEKAEALLKSGRESAANFSKNVRLLPIRTDDAWARDIGPSCVVRESPDRDRIVRGVNWKFNAWGGEVDGLYPDYQADDQAAKRICDELEMDFYDADPFVLEGGSIHVDGEGTCITTEACLLSKGRNPSMTKEEIEQKLKDYLGVTKVIWLPYGIYQDETNEHVDNVCAFVKPGEVVLAWGQKGDPQYEMSKADFEVLERETDARGRHLHITKLPVPSKPVCVREEDLPGFTFAPGEDVRYAGERLAASYVNFYIGNRMVLVPAFGDQKDEVAVQTLTKLFPGRTVQPIPARNILLGGGNIHCITQQIPRR